MLDPGGELAYDGLVIATGAHPRTLPGLPELGGVHVLRTLDDALALRAVAWIYQRLRHRQHSRKHRFTPDPVDKRRPVIDHLRRSRLQGCRQRSTR